MKISSVPIKTILEHSKGSPASLEVLKGLEDVEVILGRDSVTKEVFLLYGQEPSSENNRDHDPGTVDILVVDFDRVSDEISDLLALVQVAKDRGDHGAPG